MSIYHNSLEEYSSYLKKYIQKYDSCEYLHTHYVYINNHHRELTSTESTNILSRIYWELKKYDALMFFLDTCIIDRSIKKDILDDDGFANYVLINKPAYIFELDPRFIRNLDILKTVVDMVDSNKVLMKLPQDMLADSKSIDIILDAIEKHNENIHTNSLIDIPSTIYNDKYRALRIIRLNNYFFKKIPVEIMDDEIILEGLKPSKKFAVQNIFYLPKDIQEDIYNDGSFTTFEEIFKLILCRKKMIAKMSRFAPDSHFRFQ